MAAPNTDASASIQPTPIQASANMNLVGETSGKSEAEIVSDDESITLSRIFWRLRFLENTAAFLQDSVCIKDSKKSILLTNGCVIVFDRELHELGESILNIIHDLEDVNSIVQDISKIGEQLKDANNQIVTLLTFLLPNGHTEYVPIYDEFLSTFDLLLGNVREIIKKSSEELHAVFSGGAS